MFYVFPTRFLPVMKVAFSGYGGEQRGGASHEQQEPTAATPVGGGSSHRQSSSGPSASAPPPRRFLLEELRNLLVLTRNFLLKAAKKTFPQISTPRSFSRFQSVGVMEGSFIPLLEIKLQICGGLDLAVSGGG